MIYAEPEAEKCYESAVAMLDRMIVEQDVEISLMVKFFDAHSEDETIVLDSVHRFTTGRSLKKGEGYVSVADFIAPAGGEKSSTAGLFAIKVEDHHQCCDCKSYEHLLRESLCARIAQAAAEWMDGMISEGTRIIRPAFGYNSIPDHSLKEKALSIIDPEGTLGITLTSSYAMVPTTSICGMIISHPQAKYI
jgi:5-methyltetrahydrofolate--homocysteine methyltransferase